MGKWLDREKKIRARFGANFVKALVEMARSQATSRN